MGESRTSSNRVSAYEAARVMGLTVDAIRKRISRGTIPYEKDEKGRVWVLLDTDQDASSKVHDTDQPQSDVTALISAKDETIATLREQLEDVRRERDEQLEDVRRERDEWKEQARMADRLLSAAMERIPAIEAPTDSAPNAPGSHERGEGKSDSADLPAEPQAASQRPWWRRMFGQ